MIPADKLDQIIKKYVQKCKYKTQDEFWEWRTKINDLIRKNYYDERFNIRQPMAMNRGVWSLASIDYECEPKLSENMEKFLERIHEETVRAYPPYLTEDVFEESGRAEKLQR